MVVVSCHPFASEQHRPSMIIMNIYGRRQAHLLKRPAAEPGLFRLGPQAHRQDDSGYQQSSLNAEAQGCCEVVSG